MAELAQLEPPQSDMPVASAEESWVEPEMVAPESTPEPAPPVPPTILASALTAASNGTHVPPAAVSALQSGYGNAYVADVVTELRSRNGNGEKKPGPPPATSQAPSAAAPAAAKPSVVAPKPTASVAPPAAPEVAAAPETEREPTPKPPEAAPAPAPASEAAVAAPGEPAEAVAAPPPTPEAAPPAPGTAPELSGEVPEGGAVAIATAAPAGTEAAVAGEAAAAPEAGAAPAEAEAAEAGGAVPVEERSPSSPEEDPAYQAFLTRARAVARREGHNTVAQRKATEAQAAAPPPANQLHDSAAGKQVTAMSKEQPAQFDKEKFKKALMDKVAAIAPKNLEQADEFKEEHKASSIKGEVVSNVQESKKNTQAPIKEATDAQPDPSTGEVKDVAPLPPTPAGAPPPDIAAQDAAPKPKTDSEVSLEANSREVDAATQEADPPFTKEMAQKSNEPEFQAADQAKDTAQQDAASRPATFRQDEQAILAGAQQEAAGNTGAQTQAMHQSRKGQFAQVVDVQGKTQTADQQRRAEVLQHIRGIYEDTKTKVNQRLDRLDQEVNTAFDAGAEHARQMFENYVDERMRAYKSDRYGGWTGGLKWAKDKLFGMPDEVNVFYTEGRDLYISLMDAVVDQVATIVATGLNEAMTLIADGKQRVNEYVESLPAALKQVGDDAAAGVQAEFDQLAQEVTARQDKLIDTLAKKYSDNLAAVDARIEEMKAANRGLVDAALDAIKAVIRTIIKLKNMLLNVLAKAASVIGAIISDPIGFLGNLIAAVQQGLSRFTDNIVKHLQQGLMQWLFGTLAEAGIEMPANFDLAGILSLVLQILGLTYANIRARAVAIVGEPVVKALETTAEVFKILITQGPGGLWEYIKEKIGNLRDIVLEGIRNFVIERVIIAGITWLIGLLNPASAFIKACKAIYDIVMFIVTRGAQILSFVNAVLDSIGAIASGAIGGAAAMVENALAKAIPVVIGFLASLLGLGGISEKIKEIIQTIRAPINAAIDWVINKAVVVAKAVGGLFGGKKKEEEKPPPETKDPEHDAKVAAGLGEIDRQEEQYLEGGKISFENAEKVAASVKKNHPIFKTLVVVDGGDDWAYDWSASPGQIKPGPQKIDATTLQPPLPYNVGDKVFVYHTDQKVMAVLDSVEVVPKQPAPEHIVFFKIDTGTRKGTRYAIPADKVRNKDGVWDWTGHVSGFVVGGQQLDAQYHSSIRETFYPKGYWTNTYAWRKQQLTALENKSNPTEYWDAFAKKYVPKSNVTIDHVHPVAAHWNGGFGSHKPGNDATQDERISFYNDTSNLQIMSKESNSAKGSGGHSFLPDVKPNFRGPKE